jgi:hypothetical protein
LFEIGLSLAAARRAQQLELADVEALTCIRQRNLAALESESFEALPGYAYTRAFLRTYANALGLDADRFVAEFEAHYPEPEEEDIPSMLPRRHRRIPMRLFLTLALAAGIIGFVAWSGTSHPATIASLAPPGAPTAAPAPAVHRQPATLKPAVAVDRRLVIRAVSGPCWLVVRRGGETGPVLYEATLRQGETIRFGAQPVWVRFGAPWNVEVRRGAHKFGGLSRSQPQNILA